MDMETKDGVIFQMQDRLDKLEHDYEKLIKTFGESNYKSMPDAVYWQLRFEPAKWIAEKHIVKVYIGTDGLHQDEFLRGDQLELHGICEASFCQCGQGDWEGK